MKESRKELSTEFQKKKSWRNPCQSPGGIHEGIAKEIPIGNPETTNEETLAGANRLRNSGKKIPIVNVEDAGIDLSLLVVDIILKLKFKWSI